MDFKEIMELVREFENSSLSVLSLELNGAKLKLSKNKKTAQSPVSGYKTDGEAQDGTFNISPESIDKPVTIIPQPKNVLGPGKIVRSPIVGVFYNCASPGNPPFVKLNDKIASGDVLCIVEAMKVMNEITSQADGTLVEIYVENEQTVEYGQPLFRIL